MKGRENIWANALSRFCQLVAARPPKQNEVKLRTEKFGADNWRSVRRAIVRAQKADPELQERVQPDPATVMSERDSLVYVRDEGFWKIPVPIGGAAHAVQACHEWLCHYGREKSHKLIKDKIVIAKVENLCRRISKTCELCQQR